MAGRHCPELSFRDFAKGVTARIADHRVPIAGGLELTERCNLDCAHCYINLAPHDLQARGRELTTEQWRRVIDEIAEEGCLSLLLTGGEPLLRPDFLDIYDYAKRKGFIITLFSNGTLLTPKIADHLYDWPPFEVELTLYGMTPEAYERVTGVPGSFSRCMAGIQLLLERDLPLKLKMVVMTLNRSEFRAVRSYARELTGDFRYDAMLKPRPDGSKDVLALRLTPMEVVELDLVDDRLQEVFLEATEDPGATHRTDYLYTCGAGQRSFYVNAYGQLRPCISARDHSYDLAAGSFRDGWRGFLKRFRSQRASRESECRTCPLRLICASCPAFAQLENGDPETPVDFACAVAHLRADTYGLLHRVEAQEPAVAA